MPFKSQAQRRFMHARHPELAKEFQDATPKGAKLPEHVSDKSKKRKAMHGRAKAMKSKIAAALQPTQLIPGAPPVMRLAQPQAGQQPQGQMPPKTGPQQPQQAQQVSKGAAKVLTAQKAQEARQMAPGAIVPSEAIIAAKLDKMAAIVYGQVIGMDVRDCLGA